MDLPSLYFLHSLKVPFIKIGSGDAENIPLLTAAAALHIPLVISTGMCSIESVKRIYNIISKEHKNFVLMHCTSSYPTPENELNLNVIETYKQLFPDVIIGYSGHELGIAHTITAAKLGAKVIERHFTLDKAWKGSDHLCSITPDELSLLLSKLKSLGEVKYEPSAVALGSFEKKVQPSEEACIAKLGKSLVAARHLASGQVLGVQDVSIKVAEPRGIPCRFYEDVLGLTLKTEVAEDETLQVEYLLKPPPSLCFERNEEAA